MNKKIVTAWYKFNKQKNKFVFNHYEEGYNEEQLIPESNIPKQQKDWNKSEWRKKFGHLVEREGKPPLLTEGEE